MRASGCVGRVGGLAVALGIGAAVGGLGSGIAGASTGEASDSSAKQDSAAPSPTRAEASGSTSRSRVGRTVARQPSAGRGPGRVSGARIPLAQNDTDGGAAALRLDSDTLSSAIPADGSSPTDRASITVAEDGLVRPAASLETDVPPAASFVVAVAPPVSEAAADAPAAAAAVTPSGTVDAVDGDWSGLLPGGPVESAMSWAMVAVARRETRNRPTADIAPVGRVSTGELRDVEQVAAAAATVDSGDVVEALSPVAAVTQVDPITAIIQQVQAVISGIVEAVTQVINQVVTVVNQFVTAIVNIFVPVAPVNSAPTATDPTVGSPDAITGVVSGMVSATDADGDVLTYSAPSNTGKGSVVIDSATGVFTYTPTVDARNDAASAGATGADQFDSFTVTIADGYGGLASVPVTVPVSPVAPPSTVTVGLTTGDIVVSEGNSGSQQVPVTVALSEVSSDSVTVNYTITSVDFGGSATAGEDFVAATGSVVIAPGQTQVSVPVTVYGDTKYEGQEIFYVKLTSATGAAIVTPGAEGQRTDFARIYITNDDAAPSVVASLNQSQENYFDEGDSGTTIAPVTVTLSGPSSETVAVEYTVGGVLATAGVDYLATTGTVEFAPGQTVASIPVTIYGDTTYEGQEAIQITLTGATNAVVAADDGRGVSFYKYIYIRNDDAASTV